MKGDEAICSKEKEILKWTETVDWKALEKATRSIADDRRQRFVTKFMYNWLPVGHRLKKQGHTNDECPCCHQTKTYDHLIKCPTRTTWRKQFKELKKK